MSNLQELKDELKIISSKIELLENPKKWKPEHDLFYIAADGKITPCFNGDSYMTSGKTIENLIDLRKKQEFLNFSHAYACEHDGVKDFVYDDNNHCIYYTHMGEKYKVDKPFKSQDLEKVYMSKKDAEAYCELLNKGLVDFRYQDE